MWSIFLGAHCVKIWARSIHVPPSKSTFFVGFGGFSFFWLKSQKWPSPISSYLVTPLVEFVETLIDRCPHLGLSRETIPLTDGFRSGSRLPIVFGISRIDHFHHFFEFRNFSQKLKGCRFLVFPTDLVCPEGNGDPPETHFWNLDPEIGIFAYAIFGPKIVFFERFFRDSRFPRRFRVILPPDIALQCRCGHFDTKIDVVCWRSKFLAFRNFENPVFDPISHFFSSQKPSLARFHRFECNRRYRRHHEDRKLSLE